MNKKEVSEIKKNFKEDSGFFTLNKIILTMVNMEGDIIFTKRPTIFSMTERELDMYYKILKNVLSTKVGKNLIQYHFKADDDGKKANSTLFAVLTSKFNDDYALADYTNHIVDSMNYTGPYAIITAHSTYTVRHKRKDDTDSDNTEEYNFLVAAVCPAHIVDSGFSYDNATGEFSTESDPKLYISHEPTDGFIYPTFDNRSPNVSSVMYYCKNPKNMNDSIVEYTLGCKFTMSPITETDTFNYLISQTFSEDLNYTDIYTINDLLIDYYDDLKADTLPVKVGVKELSAILYNAGATEEDRDKFCALYKMVCDGAEFDITNLISSRIKLKTSEYTVSLKSGNGDKVSTLVSDSAKSIKLSTEDALLEVNSVPIVLK